MGLIHRFIAICFLCCTLVLALSAHAADNLQAQKQSSPVVRLSTDYGDIVLALYPEKAPATVENFLNYVNSYYYDGVIFHRVVRGFVIQAGGYGFDLYPREPGAPVINESGNGLVNKPGSIAMARTPDPDSARAQFFINLSHNKNLDATPTTPGYTVFGEVVEGMGVVRKISQQPVKRAGIHQHLPRQPIMIQKARMDAHQQADL